jgi:hypothetical protein
MEKENMRRFLIASSALGVAVVLVSIVAFQMRASAFVGPTQTVGIGSGAISVDGSGNVGIGTTVPSSTLHVVGTIQQTSVKSSLVATDANGRLVATTSASQWATSGGTIYYNGGNVGIGTATPLNTLHVQGNGLRIGSGAFGSNGFLFSQNGVGDLGISYITGTTTFSTPMTIGYAGNIGIGTSSPAAKLDVVGGINLMADGTHDAALKVGYTATAPAGYYAVYAP